MREQRIYRGRMVLRTRLSRAVVVPLAAALVLTACSPAGTGRPAPVAVQTSDPDAPLTVIADGNDRDASVATSRALFDAAPLVVVAASGDAAARS